jgi:hypothetical protein
MTADSIFNVGKHEQIKKQEEGEGENGGILSAKNREKTQKKD